MLLSYEIPAERRRSSFRAARPAWGPRPGRATTGWQGGRNVGPSSAKLKRRCGPRLDGLELRIGPEALIEEAEGLANVEAVATSSHRLEALILGFGDLSGSMGMRFGHELDKDYRYPGDMWSAHRVRMIAACRAAGIDAIDGPFGDFKNDKCYMKQATWAASLGAVGKWCIHPNQIPLANDVFAPSPREIKQAQKMVDLYNESVAQGAGAGGKGGQLVDAATLRIYEPVLERARATGRL